METANKKFVDNILSAFKNLHVSYKQAGYATPVDERVYLFISYDLVNSTSFKTAHQNIWPSVFSVFYEYTENMILRSFENAKIWKFIGDEVLFYKEITTAEELYDAAPKVYKIMGDTAIRLHELYSKTKGKLFLKSTMWIARITQETSRTNKTFGKNIVVQRVDGATDFLGPDIDLGFRISKYAERGKLTVGADLAYVLFRERGAIEAKFTYNIEERLKIVSYEKLKGIWNERLYPVIWYHERWNQPDEMFFYDDHYKSEIISNIINEVLRDGGAIRKLIKIFDDLNLHSEVQRTYDCLHNPGEELQPIAVPSFKLAEVHCAAVCFNDEGKILIGRRPESKTRLPGVWEFGCGQLRLGQTFEECLIENYKVDFSAELDFGKELIPVTTYKLCIDKEQRNVPGVIFLARISNAENIRVFSGNHTEFLWFVPETIGEEFNDKDYVPDFKETVRKAVNTWNKCFKK